MIFWLFWRFIYKFAGCNNNDNEKIKIKSVCRLLSIGRVSEEVMREQVVSKNTHKKAFTTFVACSGHMIDDWWRRHTTSMLSSICVRPCGKVAIRTARRGLTMRLITSSSWVTVIAVDFYDRRNANSFDAVASRSWSWSMPMHLHIAIENYFFFRHLALRLCRCVAVSGNDFGVFVRTCVADICFPPNDHCHRRGLFYRFVCYCCWALVCSTRYCCWFACAFSLSCSPWLVSYFYVSFLRSLYALFRCARPDALLYYIIVSWVVERQQYFELPPPLLVLPSSSSSS